MKEMVYRFVYGGDASDEDVVFLQKLCREYQSNKHGLRIEARRKANRPWNADGS